MRGERQGLDECLLATIADLTKTPLSQVRALALAFTGKSSWKDVMNLGKGFPSDLHWQAAFYVCDILDPSKQLAHVLIRASSVHNGLTVMCSASSLDPNILELPPEGRGVIVLARPYPKPGHIVAWENGKCFDSDGLGVGESLTNLKERYRLHGFVVNGISKF